MRLTEAVAQSTRIQRLFPEFWEFQISNKQRLADGNGTSNRKPALEVVKDLVEQVESIGIETDELAIVKNALLSTQEWIKRVNNLKSNKTSNSKDGASDGNNGAGTPSSSIVSGYCRRYRVVPRAGRITQERGVVGWRDPLKRHTWNLRRSGFGS